MISSATSLRASLHGLGVYLDLKDTGRHDLLLARSLFDAAVKASEVLISDNAAYQATIAQLEQHLSGKEVA